MVNQEALCCTVLRASLCLPRGWVPGRGFPSSHVVSGSACFPRLALALHTRHGGDLLGVSGGYRHDGNE